MKVITYNGIKVVCNIDIDEEEIEYYTDFVKNGSFSAPSEIYITIENEESRFASIRVVVKSEYGFDRIRRITGYLSGTLDRFNNAKKAEVADRVKHGVEEK